MLVQFACLDDMRNNRKEVISMLFLSDSLFRKEVTIETSSTGDENAIKSEIRPTTHGYFR